MQGVDELWQREVEQLDVRLKESLRTKAQLTDEDADRCQQSLKQDLLQRQSISLSHSSTNTNTSHVIFPYNSRVLRLIIKLFVSLGTGMSIITTYNLLTHWLLPVREICLSLTNHPG